MINGADLTWFIRNVWGHFALDHTVPGALQFPSERRRGSGADGHRRAPSVGRSCGVHRRVAHHSSPGRRSPCQRRQPDTPGTDLGVWPGRCHSRCCRAAHVTASGSPSPASTAANRPRRREQYRGIWLGCRYGCGHDRPILARTGSTVTSVGVAAVPGLRSLRSRDPG
jgi:hypothetical protein